MEKPQDPAKNGTNNNLIHFFICNIYYTVSIKLPNYYFDKSKTILHFQFIIFRICQSINFTFLMY